jgi:hypothetical protein
MEGPKGVTEGPGGLSRRPAIDEIGAQRLVLALFWLARFEEEPPNQTYVFRCSDMSIITMVMA